MARGVALSGLEPGLEAAGQGCLLLYDESVHGYSLGAMGKIGGSSPSHSLRPSSSASGNGLIIKYGSKVRS